MRETRTEAPDGRATVVLAALLGAAAVIGYAANSSRSHPQATAPAVRAHPASLTEVVAEAGAARESLDVEQLGRLGDELRRAAEGTTLAAKATSAELELIDVQAALALEASVRAEIDRDGRDAAQHAAGRAIAEVRTLAIGLERKHADAGRIEAAMARAELAAGTDITASFPAVLMPTYRDAELRLAALSSPVWRTRADGNDAPDQALLDEVIAQLQGAERQTNLVRLLTAVALQRGGRSIDARGLVADVLQEVPQQPLARTLQRELQGPQIAVAGIVGDSDDVDPPQPVPEPEPTPIAVAEPEPEPTRKPTPEPVAETPEPAKPEPAKPEPAKPRPIQPEATATDPTPTTAEPKPPKSEPAKKKGYEALLSEGCKLVRSGKAEQGFELLQQAFDQNPTAVAVTVCMAEAHHELDRDASARALCDRALRKAPNDRRALLLAAELELARGNDSAALNHYKKLLESHPDDAKAKAYVESHGG